MAHVESPKQDATAGELSELKRQASAEAVTVTQKIAAIEAEASVEEGAAQAEQHKEAGAEQENKFNEGSAEGQVFSEGVGQVAPAIGIAQNLHNVLSRDNNPSEGADVAKAGIVGQSFEDSFKSIKQAPIETKLGRSLTEKTSTGSMESLTKAAGMKSDSTGAAQLKVAEIKKVMENSYSHHAANEKVLRQVVAAEKAGPMPSPGSIGQGVQTRAPTLDNDSLTNGPKAPSHMDDDNESWES